MSTIPWTFLPYFLSMAKNPMSENPLEKLNDKTALHPVWLTVSEAAKIIGANTKTVRRAIQEQVLKYKIVDERYHIDFYSLLFFIYSRTKLRNKFIERGIGQYVEKWRAEKALAKAKKFYQSMAEKKPEAEKENSPAVPEDKDDSDKEKDPRPNIA